MEDLTHIRPYLISRYLLDNTDETHYVTIVQIIKYLRENHGIKAYRGTIRNDIKMLIDAGLDIELIRSTQNRYHIIRRDFDIAELKILIDAVESAKFISKSKSTQIVEKISRLAGPFISEDLKRNIDVERRVKADNGQILYIIDAVNTAINAGKQIKFQYWEYNVQKERQLRRDGHLYTLSPYRLVWNGDHYYVIGLNENRQKILSYRIDRMAAIPEILPDDIGPYPEDFDLDQHLNSMFRMFSSDRRNISLICANDTIDYIIDTFGEEIEVQIVDEENYRIEVEVAVNKNFFAWVFGFGGKVRIEGPDDIREEYRQTILLAVESAQ